MKLPKSILIFTSWILFSSNLLLGQNTSLIEPDIPWSSLKPIPTESPFPYGLASDGKVLWCVDFNTCEFFSLDLKERSLKKIAKLARIKCPSGMHYDGENLWMVNYFKAIFQINPKTGASKFWGKVKGGSKNGTTGIASDGKLIYVSDRATKKITVLDIQTKKMVRQFSIPGMVPRGMTFHDGYLWCVDSMNRTIYKLDSKKGSIVGGFSSPQGNIRGVTFADGLWWCADLASKSLKPTAVKTLPGTVLSDPLAVKIEFTSAIENKSPLPIQNPSIRVAVPKESPRQEFKNLTFTPTPTLYRNDKWGQKIAVYEAPSLASGEKMEVKWEVEGILWSVRYWPGNDHEKPSKPIDKALYLEDSPILSMNDPEIQKAARGLKGHVDDPIKLALNTRNFGLSRMSYKMEGGWDSAPVCLKRGTGSCSEYSILFSSLARANRLPTRFIGGFMRGKPEPGSKKKFVDKVFHRWVEFHTPSHGWLPLDANQEDRDSAPYPKAKFLALSNRFFTVSKTGGWDPKNLDRHYLSLHSWRWGNNKKEERSVKTPRKAIWHILAP